MNQGYTELSRIFVIGYSQPVKLHHLPVAVGDGDVEVALVRVVVKEVS